MMAHTPKHGGSQTPSGLDDPSMEVEGPQQALVLEAKPSVLTLSSASLLQTRMGTWLENHGSIAAWIGVEVLIVVLVANFVPVSHTLERRLTLASGQEEVLVAQFRGYGVAPLAVMYILTSFTAAHRMNRQLFMDAMWNFDFHVVFWGVLFAMCIRFVNFYSLFGDDCGVFAIMTYMVPLLGYIPIAVVAGSIDCMELQRWVKMMATGLFAGHLVFLHIWIDYLDDQEWPTEAACSFDVPCEKFKSLYKNLLFSIALFLFRASIRYCFGDSFATLRPQYIFGELRLADRGFDEEAPPEFPKTPICFMPIAEEPPAARSSTESITADGTAASTDDTKHGPPPRPQLRSVFDSSRRASPDSQSSQSSDTQPPLSMKPTMLRDAVGVPLREQEVEPRAPVPEQTPPPTTAASGSTPGSSKDESKSTPLPEESTSTAALDNKEAAAARPEIEMQTDAFGGVSVTPDENNANDQNNNVQALAEPEDQARAGPEGSDAPSRAMNVKMEDAICRQPQATGEDNGNMEVESAASSGAESLPHGEYVCPPPQEFKNFRELCVSKASQTSMAGTPPSHSSYSSVRSAANDSQLRERLAALVDIADVRLASKHKRFKDELTMLVSSVLQALDEKDKLAVELWHNAHGKDVYRAVEDV